MNSDENNTAFIDGQNLYLGTTELDESWKIDLIRFRVYLKYKYKVSTAYYYVGFSTAGMESLYELIQEAGFILKFKSHSERLESKKKGNIDTDLVFDVMKKMYANKDDFDKIVLVSGDGDYFQLVEFLINENKFKKILFPSQKCASSLYKMLPNGYNSNLSVTGIKRKIEKQIDKRKGRP